MSVPDGPGRALDRAVRALARRDHSAASLRAVLAGAGVPEEAQEEAIEALRQAGYLDDERFVLNRAERLAERGLGDAAIRDDLERRGIERALVEAAIAALEPEAVRAARVAKRLGGGVRAARTLARKGFCEESIERVVCRGVAESPS